MINRYWKAVGKFLASLAAGVVGPYVLVYLALITIAALARRQVPDFTWGSPNFAFLWFGGGTGLMIWWMGAWGPYCWKRLNEELALIRGSW